MRRSPRRPGGSSTARGVARPGREELGDTITDERHRLSTSPRSRQFRPDLRHRGSMSIASIVHSSSPSDVRRVSTEDEPVDQATSSRISLDRKARQAASFQPSSNHDGGDGYSHARLPGQPQALYGDYGSIDRCEYGRPGARDVGIHESRRSLQGTHRMHPAEPREALNTRRTQSYDSLQLSRLKGFAQSGHTQGNAGHGKGEYGSFARERTTGRSSPGETDEQQLRCTPLLNHPSTSRIRARVHLQPVLLYLDPALRPFPH